MPRPVLRGGYAALALKIQEAAGDLSSRDVCARLSNALQDAGREMGHWCYYIDHFGDDVSGDVIYSWDGDTCRAPYEISGGAGAAKCIIDMEQCEDVVPRTIYEVEQDEADHMASMESLRSEKLYGDVVPTYERFVSKATRDKASASDFAGKGKSFPILKAEDVAAAASSLGRAGPGNYDIATIKANIIRIAKRKGFPLPKAWQKESKESAATELADQLSEAGARHSAEDMKALQTIHDTANKLGASCPDTFRMAGSEAAGSAGLSAGSAGLRLVESGLEFCQEIRLNEAARTNYPIRIISPGTGTTAHYPADVLKREAAKFKPGTLMFWNHPTAVEESQRPEGDLDNLAAIITSQGRYEENGPKGPGVYADAKVMADYAQKVEERAPHIGVSIRAGGLQDGDRLVEGKPVLKEFSYIESVDYVTKAGRGGLALAEAARNAGLLDIAETAAPAAIQTQEVGGMDADELKALKESNARLLERAVYQDAVILARNLLDSVTLAESLKRMITENVIGTDGAWKYIPRKDGGLDREKFSEMINVEAKRVGKAFKEAGGGRAAYEGPVEEPKPEEIEARETARKRDEAQAEDIFGEIMGNKEAAKLAARGRAA